MLGSRTRLAPFALLWCAATLAACSKNEPPPADAPVRTAAVETPSFKVCWTIYAGWMPWEYGAAKGPWTKTEDERLIGLVRFPCRPLHPPIRCATLILRAAAAAGGR